jgi:hypothetical protein
MATANVRFARTEIRRQFEKWQLIRDCLDGEQAVKAQGDVYLPRPNSADKSEENKARYASYLKRAVFYNTTRRTLDGLVGQVFVRDPVYILPDGLEKTLLEDIDGAGCGFHEQAKKTLADTMSFGRTGLFVDYPPVTSVVTKQQQDAGYVRPVVILYQPENVINWRTALIGSKRLLSLVVLQEQYLARDDGFQPIYEFQWRILKLVPVSSVAESIRYPPDTQHLYSVEIWREIVENAATPDTRMLVPVNTYFPRDSEGNVLTEIPFTFVGSMSNDPDVDPAPLYDLAILNIAHYRNSADYEEACFLVGQPTVYAAGLTESWVKDVLGGGIQIGSRAVIPLPVGGTAGLLQVSPNSLPKEAMDQKEKEMVALGARLVEQRKVQQTLGEAQQKEAAQMSILASVAKNVGAGYTRCLHWCSLYQGSDGEVKYELNTDFLASQMTSDERAQLVAEWQAGGISYTEYRTKIRKAGIATQNDEESRKEAEGDPLRAPKKDPKVDPNLERVAPGQNSKTQT